MRLEGNFYIDDEARPIHEAVASYENATSANGNVAGTTLICADLANEPSYTGLSVKVLSGNAAGQIRRIAAHVAGTNTLTVEAAFTDNAGAAVQIVAGTRFVIVPFEYSMQSIERATLFKDQWCETPIAALAITNVAADLTFSNVVFPAGFLPAGAVIQSVYLMLHWRKQVDTSTAVNAINGASKTIRVKLSTGAWGTDDLVGITFADNSLNTGGSCTEGGTMIIGSHDISGEVDDADNATYNIRSDQTNRADALVVDGNALTLYDVFTGLRVYYTLL